MSCDSIPKDLVLALRPSFVPDEAGRHSEGNLNDTHGKVACGDTSFLVFRQRIGSPHMRSKQQISSRVKSKKEPVLLAVRAVRAVRGGDNESGVSRHDRDSHLKTVGATPPSKSCDRML